jgi:hypothetical protein
VFCADDEWNDNGGVVCDSTWTWSQMQLDSTDSFSITYNSTELDSVPWNSDWFNGTTGQSLGASTGISGPDENNTKTSWCLQESALTDGNYGTPGAATVGC